MAPTVPTIKLDSHELPVIGFGAMGLSMAYGPSDRDSAKKLLVEALDLGYVLINTADIYGPAGDNEKLIGEALGGALREKAFIVTKFGHRLDADGKTLNIDCSKEYAAQAIDASIARLGFTPDAWLAHRVDKKVPIEDTVQAMQDARLAGKTKYIGLSECSAATLRRASKVAKIDFIEIEYSPWTLDHESNGVLATAKELGVIVLAYSPLGRGFLTGRFKSPADFQAAEGTDFRAALPRLQADVFEHNYQLVKAIGDFAARKGCTPAQLTLSWLVAQEGNILPIPGTKSSKYLRENWNATANPLTPAEVTELRQLIEAHVPKGGRYPEMFMKNLDP